MWLSHYIDVPRGTIQVMYKTTYIQSNKGSGDSAEANSSSFGQRRFAAAEAAVGARRRRPKSDAGEGKQCDETRSTLSPLPGRSCIRFRVVVASASGSWARGHSFFFRLPYVALTSRMMESVYLHVREVFPRLEQGSSSSFVFS